MRATLLSLQNTAKLQDLTSNRLASGLKFSTAIDNPSAFYTAQSLSDRAGDLNILLDAMSQGIQTLKAVAETIQTAQALLGQAAAVANQALSEAENVIARVSTEEELLAAVNSGRSGMIVVENDIDMSQTVLKLADGQSLVGKSYFSSSGSAVKIKASSVYAGENSLISNLNLQTREINVENKQNVTLSNLDTTGTFYLTASEVAIRNQINISNRSSGFYVTDSSLIFSNGSVLNSYTSARTVDLINSSCVIEEKAVINAQTLSDGLETFSVRHYSRLDIYGTVNANNEQAGFIWLTREDNWLNIFGSARIYAEIPSGYSLFPQSAGQTIFIEQGAELGFKQDTKIMFFKTLKDFVSKENALGFNDFIKQKDYFADAGVGWDYDFSGFKAYVDDLVSQSAASSRPEKENRNEKLFKQILSQYNALVRDASYKGINLLAGQNLKISFNEDRSSNFEIRGVNASFGEDNIVDVSWFGAADVEKSLSCLADKTDALREYDASFGYCHNILTIRQNFTEKMINILEEGADKLVLADMNQESANMLALQTRSLLAVNALSLASRAARSVLKLF